MTIDGADETRRPIEFTLDDLLDWAASALGSPVSRSDSSWRRDKSMVLQLRDRDGTRWFLKHPRDAGRFERELSAYETVLHTFGDRVPRLVDASVPLRCMLFSALPGELAKGSNRAVDPEVHRQAGAFLARLHGSVPPEPAPDMNQRLAAQRDWVLERAEGMIEPALLEYLRRATAVLIEIDEPVTVLCHLDFWPRNWLVDEHGSLRVIDFGQATRDLAIRDFSLLAHRGPARPHLQEAFFDGYGRPLDDDEQAQLEGLAVLTGVRRVLRSKKNQSPLVRSRALRLLAQATSRARQQE